MKNQLIAMIIIALTISFIQANIYPTQKIAAKLTQSEVPDVKVVDFNIMIKQDGKYIPREQIAQTGAGLPKVTNYTETRFVATFLNEAAVDTQLKTLEVRLFNSSEAGDHAAEAEYTKEYSLVPLEQITLKPHNSKTDVLEARILFSSLNDVYHLQCRFKYDKIGVVNGSNLYINAPANITIAVDVGTALPPEFIIWGMIISLAIVIFMVSIGYLGRRREKITNMINESKSNK